MYTKLKEEFRTIEFINKYLSQFDILKQKSFSDYEKNHFLLDNKEIPLMKNPEDYIPRKSKNLPKNRVSLFI